MVRQNRKQHPPHLDLCIGRYPSERPVARHVASSRVAKVSQPARLSCCEHQQYPHVALSDQSHHSRWEICECKHHNKPDINEKEFVTPIDHRVFNHFQSFCPKPNGSADATSSGGTHTTRLCAIGTGFPSHVVFGTHHEDRWPTHGYEPTREAAMAAFAKSWRRG